MIGQRVSHVARDIVECEYIGAVNIDDPDSSLVLEICFFDLILVRPIAEPLCER